jgi:hypothetical protein
VLAVAAAFLIVAGWVEGTSAQARPQQQSSEIETVRVRPNVHMLVGAGGNIVVQLGWMGVVLVDTGSAEMADRVLAAIQRLTDTRIRFIINTGAGAEHVGGNAALARAGRNLLRVNSAGGFAGSDFQTNSGAAGIMAHENVLNRMSATVGDKSAFPGVGWPTEAFTGARIKSLYLNNDGVQILYQPAAHSDRTASCSSAVPTSWSLATSSTFARSRSSIWPGAGASTVKSPRSIA